MIVVILLFTTKAEGIINVQKDLHAIVIRKTDQTFDTHGTMLKATLSRLHSAAHRNAVCPFHNCPTTSPSVSPLWAKHECYFLGQCGSSTEGDRSQSKYQIHWVGGEVT
jgi:hypothetical protein